MCEMSKPCAVFEEDEINSAFYVGQSKIIGDTITDMVAVAADNIQAELWVGAQDYLPRLIRVAYPRKPAHALYQTKHSDWHLLDAVDPATFTSGAAAGLAAGAAVGAAATAAASAPAYVVGGSYALLPGGCIWQPSYREYNCNGTWFLPAYGANGIYYSVVPAP